jgi:hypothetical protein
MMGHPFRAYVEKKQILRFAQDDNLLLLGWLLLRLTLLLLLRLALLVLRRWGLAVGWCWRFRTVGELESVADDVEVLFGQIGFEQLAIGRVEKLHRNGVL